jgi:ArsR family transcriptional regulator, zinc-responsive transcriptional repressor
MKQNIQLSLLSLETLQTTAECLRAMAHPIRLRIAEILMQGEFQVHEIAELCQLPTNQTSEHLRLLKGMGLLDSLRRGRSVYYRIANDRLPALIECIRKTCDVKSKELMSI